MPATRSGRPPKAARASTAKTSSDTMTTRPSSSDNTAEREDTTGPPDDLGAWIRDKRRALGLTQVQLCELADIPDRKTVSRAENGKTRPTELSILRIAKVLGPPPASVIDAGGYAGIASVLRTLEPLPLSGAASSSRSRARDKKSHPAHSKKQRRQIGRERRRPISWIKLGGTEDE